MTEVISVKFKNRGKSYYFAPGMEEIPDGAQVIVETSRGLEIADCVKGNHYVDDSKLVPPLRPVLRIATPDDLRIADICRAREKEAFAICEAKIAEHGLDMKLVDVECCFDGTKIVFFFTSDGRVDFRELVRDLASVFRTRIELRQIGVRDEAKLVGGIGMCGRPYCCNQFLNDFLPVSTKMAKTQSLSLNPAKISGACGRLMCCLRYEEDAYKDLISSLPRIGTFVETTMGYGTVAQLDLMRQRVKVKPDGDGEQALRTFGAGEYAVVPGGRPKPGEPLPHVLERVPAPAPEKPEDDDGWQRPPVFADDTLAADGPEAPKPDAEKRAARRPQRRRGQRQERPAKPKGDAPASAESAAKPKSKQGANSQGAKKPSEKPESAKKPAAKKPEGAKEPERAKRGGRAKPKSAEVKAKPAEAKAKPDEAKAGSDEAKKTSRPRRRKFYPRKK